MITERIEKRKKERDEFQGQLAIEMGKQITFTAPQIKSFLYSLKRGNINDENNRRGIINIFVRALYLWDDRITLILNGGDKAITIDDILLDEIEEYFEDAISSRATCSPLVADAPPRRSKLHIACSDFFKRQSARIPLFLLLSRDPLVLGSRLIVKKVRIWIARPHHNPRADGGTIMRRAKASGKGRFFVCGICHRSGPAPGAREDFPYRSHRPYCS